MSLSDPVADMLTKIRNASSARFESVDIPTSKLKLEITKILKNEGYIKNFKKVTQDGMTLLRIFLTIGVLGGFTTFSTFSYETLALLREGSTLSGLMNVFLSVAGCLLATWLGTVAGKLL